MTGAAGDERTGRVAALAQGGEGVIRDPGQPVVFVPDTAPGDLVRYRVRESARSYSRGDLLEVMEPGPARRAPPCPEAGRCGGCDWQHLHDDAQADTVRALLEDALRRTGKLPLDAGCVRATVMPSPPLRYRQRARFHLDLAALRPTLGYLRRASHAVLAPAECFVLEPELEALRMELARALPRLAATLSGVARAELQVDLPSPSAGTAQLRIQSSPSVATRQLEDAAALLLSLAPLAAVEVVAATARDAARRAPQAVARAGEDAVAYRRGPPESPERFPAWHSPGGFLQASRSGNAALVSLVLEAARPWLDPGASVLELFAGDGNFTLPLVAAGARLASVESDSRAVRNARRAVEASGMAVELHADDAAARTLALTRAGQRYELVVLDPPRTGARELVPLLAATGARAVVYVSCDAVTLARDAALLARDGFVLRSAQPLLLFPQTAHFETVAAFSRGGA